jgi:hypothetical protein
LTSAPLTAHCVSSALSLPTSCFVSVSTFGLLAASDAAGLLSSAVRSVMASEEIVIF